MTANHRRPTTTTSAYRWLGTGALTLGIGAAALAGGTGVAAAKTGDSHSTAAGHSAAEHHKPAAGAHNKARHIASAGKAHATATAATAAPAPEPVSTSKAKQSKHISAATGITTAPPAGPAVADHPTAVVARVAVLNSAAATTTTTKAVAAAAASTNPLANDIQKTLLGIEAMFSSALANVRTTAAAVATTNPIATLGTDIQKWIHQTFFNSAPTITVSAPTLNADGSYTGQVTASDPDGDPLRIGFNPIEGGTTTLVADGNNTYTYTYTPSASALSDPGYIHDLSFSALETNAADHFHGLAQIQNLVLESTVGNALRALRIAFKPYDADSWGTAYDSTDIAVGPPINLSNSAAATGVAATDNPADSITTIPKPAAATDPLTALATAVRNALHGLQTMFFNTPPKFSTITVPTLNADGTYSGRAVATDADGDPLRYSVYSPYDGSTVTIDQRGNYTVTPSAEALSKGTQDGFTVTVSEANADTHYHGIGEYLMRIFDNFMNSHFAGNGYYWTTTDGTVTTYIPAFSLTTGTTTTTV